MADVNVDAPGDGQANPPPPVDDDAPPPPQAPNPDRVKADFCGTLLKLIYGKNVDPALLGGVIASADAARALSDREPSQISVANVTGIIVGTHAQMFEDTGADVDLLALGRQFSAQADAEINFAKNDKRTDTLAADRLVMAELAKKVIEAGLEAQDMAKLQKGYELLETVRAARYRIEANKRAINVDAPSDEVVAAREDARKDVADLSQDWERVKEEWEDLRKRRDGVESICKRLSETTPDSRKYVDGVLSKMSDISLAIISAFGGQIQNEHLPDTPQHREMIEDVRTRVKEAHKILDGIEKPLRKYLNKRVKKLVDDFGRFVKTSGGDVKRHGGDDDGGGHVTPGRRAKYVPKEVLDESGAKIQALKELTENGLVLDAHFEAIQDIYRETAQTTVDLWSNADKYADLSKRIAHERSRLNDDDYAYIGDVKQTLLSELEAIEELSKKNLVDALADLTKTEKKRQDKKADFKSAKEDYKLCEKTYDKFKSKLTGDYAKTLKSAISDFEKLPDVKGVDDENRTSRGILNFLRRRESYKGTHAKLANDAWASLDVGSESERTDFKGLLATQTEEVDDDIARLKDIQAFAKQIRKQKSDPSDDELDILKDEAKKFVDDLNMSGKEIVAREAGKEIFEKLYDKVDDYFDRKKKNMIKSESRESYTNFEVDLKMLKKRKKATRTSEEWDELNKDLEALNQKIAKFRMTHIKRDEPNPEKSDIEGKRQVVLEAVRELRTCGREVDSFVAYMNVFYQDVIAPYEERAEAEAKLAVRNPEVAETAIACAELIRQKGSALIAYGRAVASIIGGHNFSDMADRLRDAPSPKAELAVREEAASALRRRREFLRGDPLGKLYDENPFDEGAAAIALRSVLATTEGKLMALVKLD